MSSYTDISDYFEFEVWSPQSLPQDAYKGAAFYQVPQYLYWTVLEADMSFSRQPEINRDFLRIPFRCISDDYLDYARNWGKIMLLLHVREHLSSNGYTSTHDTLIETVNRLSTLESSTKVLTFSDEQRDDLQYRVSRHLDSAHAQKIEYPQMELPEGVDEDTVLVFTLLGRIVCGVSCCGYGIALRNWGISVLKLPPVPKTRYTRVLEGQVI